MHEISYKNSPNQNIKLSIIIPLYNTEKYVEDTLLSIIPLVPKSVEIIVIDDGSTDNSLNIVKEFMQGYCQNVNVTLIHKTNEGPSLTRNYGISIAIGEYITFFDSDDLAVPATYDKLLNVLEFHNVDFVIARGVSFDNVTQQVFPFPDSYVWDHIMQHNVSFQVITLEREPRVARLESSSVVRIFKKKFIEDNKISFPQGIFFEDSVFHVECMVKARKVALLNDVLLFYRTNRSGQTTSLHGKRRFDMLLALDRINEIVNENIENIPDSVGANFTGLLLRMVVWCLDFCLPEDKVAFFTDALPKFNRQWVELYKEQYSFDEFERTICNHFLKVI